MGGKDKERETERGRERGGERIREGGRGWRMKGEGGQGVRATH